VRELNQGEVVLGLLLMLLSLLLEFLSMKKSKIIIAASVNMMKTHNTVQVTRCCRERPLVIVVASLVEDCCAAPAWEKGLRADSTVAMVSTGDTALSSPSP